MIPSSHLKLVTTIYTTKFARHGVRRHGIRQGNYFGNQCKHRDAPKSLFSWGGVLERDGKGHGARNCSRTDWPIGMRRSKWEADVALKMASFLKKMTSFERKKEALLRYHFGGKRDSIFSKKVTLFLGKNGGHFQGPLLVPSLHPYAARHWGPLWASSSQLGKKGVATFGKKC